MFAGQHCCTGICANAILFADLSTCLPETMIFFPECSSMRGIARVSSALLGLQFFDHFFHVFTFFLSGISPK